MVNPSSALGEAVGSLIEGRIFIPVYEICKKHSYIAVKGYLKNGSGNKHNIDIIVYDNKNNPIILIEPKYLRYTKHNWDKGSRLTVGHYLLRKHHKTIQKSMAVLAGNWTDNSKDFIKSMGVEIHEISFDIIKDTFIDYGIPYDWDEKDHDTPKIAWEKYQCLTSQELYDIGSIITNECIDDVVSSVETTLLADPNEPKEIDEIEILLKTTKNEYFVTHYKTANEAIKYLLALQADKKDLSEVL